MDSDSLRVLCNKKKFDMIIESRPNGPDVHGYHSEIDQRVAKSKKPISNSAQSIEKSEVNTNINFEMILSDLSG